MALYYITNYFLVISTLLQHRSVKNICLVFTLIYLRTKSSKLRILRLSASCEYFGLALSKRIVQTVTQKIKHTNITKKPSFALTILYVFTKVGSSVYLKITLYHQARLQFLSTELSSFVLSDKRATYSKVVSILFL